MQPSCLPFFRFLLAPILLMSRSIWETAGESKTLMATTPELLAISPSLTTGFSVVKAGTVSNKYKNGELF